MKRKKYPVGMSSFAELIQKKYDFIDKTLFIKEVIEDSSPVLLFTRPRRFGKTLNLSMLQEFFSTEGKNLFQGLNISQDSAFCL